MSFLHNDWLLLALIAPLLWSIVVLIDDNLLRKVYRSAAFGAMIAGLFGVFPFLYFSITNNTVSLPPRILGAAIGSGILTICFYYFYFRALQTDEPSTVVAMLNLMPVFVIALAALLLHETLHSTQYVGVSAIILASTYLAVIDIKKFKLTKAVFFIIWGSLIYAVASILGKYAYDYASFSIIFPWISFGFFIAGATILILGGHSGEAKKIVRKSGLLLIVALTFTEVLNFAAEFTQGLAISRGPVSIIRTIEGIQPLYMLAFALLLGPFIPGFFREQIDNKLPRKLVSIALMLGGLYLIAS